MKYTAMQQAIAEHIAVVMAEQADQPQDAGYICTPYPGMLGEVATVFNRRKTKRLMRDIKKALHCIKTGCCRYEITDGYNSL